VPPTARPRPSFKLAASVIWKGHPGTLFGSLIRAGGREIMDSARVAHAIVAGGQVDFPTSTILRAQCLSRARPRTVHDFAPSGANEGAEQGGLVGPSR